MHGRVSVVGDGDVLEADTWKAHGSDTAQAIMSQSGTRMATMPAKRRSDVWAIKEDRNGSEIFMATPGDGNTIQPDML